MIGSATWSGLGRRQWIMPDISFTCNGSITMWIVGARWNNDVGNQIEYPNLQIWRRRSQENTLYDRIRETNLNDATGENRNQLYIFSLNPPLEFQTGDILGLYQPREHRSRLIAYLDTSSGPSNYYENSPLTTFTTASRRVRTQNALPLVTVGKYLHIMHVVHTISDTLSSLQWYQVQHLQYH